MKLPPISPTAGHLPPLVRAQDGGTVRWATGVSLFHDGERLRARFDCRDERRWATLTERDAPLWKEEVVELFLAPGPETPKRYVELEVNPLGALFDAVVDNPDGNPHGRRDTLRVDTSWDAPGIQCRVEPHDRDEDWSAELVVPWREVLHGLGVSSSEPLPRTWRANVFRVERPGRGADDEYSCWSPTFRNPADFHVPDRFGFFLLDDVEGNGAEGDGEPDPASVADRPVIRVPLLRPSP